MTISKPSASTSSSWELNALPYRIVLALCSQLLLVTWYVPYPFPSSSSHVRIISFLLRGGRVLSSLLFTRTIHFVAITDMLSWRKRALDFILYSEPVPGAALKWYTPSFSSAIPTCLYPTLLNSILSPGRASRRWQQVQLVVIPVHGMYNRHVGVLVKVGVVGVKGRFQSFVEFAFSVLLETRKSLLCVQ